MENEGIKAVKSWPKPQSVQDIQVFIGFANFYRRFIQGFSRIAASLTSILKTTSVTQPILSPTNVGRPLGADDEVVGFGGESIKKLAKSKSTEPSPGAGLLTPEARLVFTRLRQAFTKAPF